uniref:Putative 5' nucleotidase n=1 Tax=Amblyomma triste TaxID=251400 RepID=A0A023GNG7_AMBTT
MLRLICIALVSSWVHSSSADGNQQSSGGTFNMTILHTNDVHSRILESDKNGFQCTEKKRNESKCYGGVARIAQTVRELKNNTTNTLFLNAGDFFQGTLWYSILKHNIVSAVMANMSYDAVCLGNHEFDDGPEGLAPFLVEMQEANVTVLGTNLNTSTEPLFDNASITLPKSKVYTYSGIKVALLGVVTTETITIARPGGVQILPEAHSINSEIEKLKKDNVSVFILVSHVGFDVDQKLADQCPDLDLIVGGHTNTFLYTGPLPVKVRPEGPYPFVHNRTDGTRCLIVQDYRFGMFLGFLQLEINETGTITKWSGNPILLSQNLTEDQTMLNNLEPYKKIVEAAVNKVVGSTKVLLEANGKLCRYKECNSVNLMADSFLDYYANRNSSVPEAWSIVNAAVINGGIGRDSIEQKPNVTLGDLLGAMPYDSDLVVMNISGYNLQQMFEYSVENFTWYPDLNGKFLQVSGARVVYNFSLPNGCRVVSLKVLCANCSVPVYEDVVANNTYSIVTTAFIANGGDGFKFDKSVTKRTDGVSAFDVYTQYFTKMSPIKTPEEGRVIVLDLPPRPNSTTTPEPTTKGTAMVMARDDWRSMRRDYMW